MQKNFESSNNATRSQLLNDIKMWHLRLGHLPFPSLQFLFHEYRTIEVKEHLFCTICPMAKQSRLSFNSSCVKTSASFQLLHIDVWGPLRHPSRHKCSMFISIVDDFSRFTWIFVIKHKSEFLTLFAQFYEFVLTQFNK